MCYIRGRKEAKEKKEKEVEKEAKLTPEHWDNSPRLPKDKKHQNCIFVSRVINLEKHYRKKKFHLQYKSSFKVFRNESNKRCEKYIVDIKEYLSKWGDKPCSWMGNLSITNVSSPQIYLNSMQCQLKALVLFCLFEEPDNLIIKLIRKSKGPRITKILRTTKKGLILPDTKTSCSSCYGSGTIARIQEDKRLWTLET